MLIVPYRGWLGWAPTDWGARPSRFRSRRSRSWRGRSSRSTSRATLFVAAPDYTGTDAPLGADETIRMAVYRR